MEIYSSGDSRNAGSAVTAWLREQGIDWMPFDLNDMRRDMLCGRGANGNWSQSVRIFVRADVLRRLGLRPDQPLSQARCTVPWWHNGGVRQRHR